MSKSEHLAQYVQRPNEERYLLFDQISCSLLARDKIKMNKPDPTLMCQPGYHVVQGHKRTLELDLTLEELEPVF